MGASFYVSNAAELDAIVIPLNWDNAVAIFKMLQDKLDESGDEIVTAYVAVYGPNMYGEADKIALSLSATYTPKGPGEVYVLMEEYHPRTRKADVVYK